MTYLNQLKTNGDVWSCYNKVLHSAHFMSPNKKTINYCIFEEEHFFLFFSSLDIEHEFSFFSFQSIFEGYFVNIRKCNYSCVEGYIIHTYINASNRIKFMIDHHCHLLEYVNGVCTHIRKKKKEEASFPSASRKEE